MCVCVLLETEKRDLTPKLQWLYSEGKREFVPKFGSKATRCVCWDA